MIRIFQAWWNVVLCIIGFAFFAAAQVCYKLLTARGKHAVQVGFIKSLKEHYDTTKPDRKDANVQNDSACGHVASCTPAGCPRHTHRHTAEAIPVAGQGIHPFV
jgi:hypothetical protein